MEKYKYIIVDDEYTSHLTISHHFKQYKNFTCVATFYNPEEALIFLHKNEIDLIILDIEMPEMSGFQFLEALKQDVFVIILTAYAEKHSLVAHNYYDRNLFFFTNKSQLVYYFPKIISRFEQLYSEREKLNRINQLSKNEVYTFPKKINKQTINLTDIKIIEVIGHNIVLIMKDKEEHVFRMTFRELKYFLPKNIFFQIRRNIIINILYVTALNDITICLGEHHFQISTRKQKEIMLELQAVKQKLNI